jgi:hypothetical protein
MIGDYRRTKRERKALHTSLTNPQPDRTRTVEPLTTHLVVVTLRLGVPPAGPRARQCYPVGIPNCRAPDAPLTRTFTLPEVT